MPMYVYILASDRNGTLYIGVTRDLAARLAQHRRSQGSIFVAKYRVLRLVHIEAFENPLEAITREKQLKKWKRAWKLELIEKDNSQWKDLSVDVWHSRVIPAKAAIQSTNQTSHS